MLNMENLKNDHELLNAIDWEMTPEEAVRLYLEWGNNWASGNYVIRSKDDVTHYFVVNTWEEKPVVYLLRRNSEQALELARVYLPPPLAERFLESTGGLRGVYSIAGEVKDWLKAQLSPD